MSRHALLVLIAVTAGAAVPAPAIAASYAADGSNQCLSADLDVSTALTAAAGSPAGTVTATIGAVGAAGQRVSRLHLDLEVQERTATAWIRFVTPGHAETYTRAPGSRIHRTWTLREDAGPIEARLAANVQMRVYAKFSGVCRGQSLGPPLLLGLSAPMFSPAAA